MWTLLGCEKPSVSVVKRHLLAVLSMRMRTKLSTGGVKLNEESAFAAR